MLRVLRLLPSMCRAPPRPPRGSPSDTGRRTRERKTPAGAWRSHATTCTRIGRARRRSRPRSGPGSNHRCTTEKLSPCRASSPAGGTVSPSFMMSRERISPLIPPDCNPVLSAYQTTRCIPSGRKSSVSANPSTALPVAFRSTAPSRCAAALLYLNPSPGGYNSRCCRISAIGSSTALSKLNGTSSRPEGHRQ